MKETSFSTRNYSVEANFEALEQLVEGNPSLWSDKYLMGTGNQLLRLIAAGQSANGVRTLQALNESLLNYMQRLDSILGFGETMGYNAFRGSNDIIEVTVKTDQAISIPARSVVGSVKGVDLVNITAINSGADEYVKFQAKVGNLKTESRKLVDTTYKYIRFLSQNISDDVILYINDIQTDYYTMFKDVVDSTANMAYVMLTNAYQGIDLFFINLVGSYEIEPSDIFKISYIEYTDINYTTTDVNFLYGEVLPPSEGGVVLSVAGEKPQTVESLRTAIPYFRDTQREILANRDPQKVLKLLMPSTESTSGTNLNTVHSLLTYKYEDYHLVPDEQLKTYESELAPTYYFGFCPSTIVQPTRFHTGLDIDIVMMDSRVQITNIQEQIDEVLNNYQSLPVLLNGGIIESINLDNIESELNKFTVDGIPVVKTAYVNLHAIEMENNTRVELGEVYKENDTYYRALGFKYQSGNIPSSISQTTYTRCGNIYLEPYRLIYGYEQLQANTYYAPNTMVGTDDTHVYRVHPYYVVPATEPQWNTELGGLTYSGDLVWLTIDFVPGTSYNSAKNKPAIKGKIVTPSGSEVSYQLIGFTKTVSSIVSDEIVTLELSEGLGTRKIKNLWDSYTILYTAREPNIYV